MELNDLGYGQIIAIILVGVLLLIGIGYLASTPNTNRTNYKSCEKKGGVFNGFKGGSICVKDGLIIEME